MRKNRCAMLGALRALNELGPRASNKQIGYVAGIKPNSISSAIYNIEAAGWIRRVGHHAKRHLYITDEGREALSPTPKRTLHCLDCGGPFRSEGIHNRICQSCKSEARWRSSEATEYEVRL